MKQSDFTNGFPQIFRNLKELFFARPDNSRRPCAAISTLRTCKRQAIAIPWTGLVWWPLFETGLFQPGQLRQLFFGHDTILVV